MIITLNEPLIGVKDLHLQRSYFHEAFSVAHCLPSIGDLKSDYSKEKC